ncbi:MAG: hypothetical protein C3F19_08105 [Rhodocyclales bacterium]|jgi:hypothetical protein|nr:hypothetical protein [Rhodocyclaceae bacterium]PWB40953.1 MAG: hypothetical protein C3F19_08105 [Rhodocyclales bacterium]GIK24111.1 MAG: hypothetical protein BroJett006_03570 [Betaproteobacteria bacterium]
MSHAEAWARQIAVRHREAGHLRFELPAELCEGPRADALENGLVGSAGIYRATLYRAARKFSLRYDPHQASEREVVKALRARLDALPGPLAQALQPAAQQLGQSMHAAKEKLETGARRKLAQFRLALMKLRQAQPKAGSLQARLQPVLANALTEKAIINFLNDLLAFYLIKVHWELITKRWMRNPVAHADAWLAIFYLMYLLVRYRKTNK